MTALPTLSSCNLQSKCNPLPGDHGKETLEIKVQIILQINIRCNGYMTQEMYLGYVFLKPLQDSYELDKFLHVSLHEDSTYIF